MLAAAVMLGAVAVGAQETETKVVDEVVAQVNDGVITLSKVRREAKDIVDSRVAEGVKREQAQHDVDEKQGELIANLINEELLIQKAKELGLDGEVEAAINQRFLEIMRQGNMRTLDELYEAMRRQGVDPNEMREMWRKQAIRDKVIQREVQAKLYWEPTAKQIREYYEKNKAKFTKPEKVGLTELFLSFAGRDENQVRAKAAELAKQARAGADFAKLVAENSDRPDAAKTKGSVGVVPLRDLDPKFQAALKDVPAGGITDPVDMDNVGMVILRVDERQAASSESQFDEDAVRVEMMKEKYPDEAKKFMSKLRADAYIKINDTYRPIVSPILFADERKDHSPN